MYSLTPATDEHISELASNMRAGDIAEVWASSRCTPLEAITLSCARSEEAYTGLADGKVMGIFGVYKATPLSTIGVPWLMTSNEVWKHRRAFMKMCRGVVDYWKAFPEYDKLVNFTDSRYKEAVKWMQWLGFEITGEAYLGPDAVKFYRFEMVI